VTTVSGLVLGAMIGLGAWLILVGLLPPHRSLADVIAEALAPSPPEPPTISEGPGEATGWAARWGRPFAGLLTGLGLPRRRIRQDLAVLDRPVEQHLAEQATAALAGLLTPPLLGVAAAVVGIDVGIAVPMWAGLILAVLAFFAPDLQARSQAAARRADFRHAFAAFLDLVVVALAGGAGVEGALDAAASVGTGWSFARLRHALAAAALTRQAPWIALGRLGTDLDIPELAELAATVTLAGSEGAKVRASLTAKAAALRTRQLTDAEAAAQAATERMSLPVVVLFTGFLIFIAFPAISRVLTAL
jgi:tight adherence protein C